MSDVSAVRAELEAFFPTGKLPPVVFVEWTMPLIEIELIAWGGEHNSGPVVEYLTPPGMSSSPVFSRVARINSSPSIYTAGLYAREAVDAAGEVNDIFGQLDRALRGAGSDLRHLVKATYYCSSDASSRRLNELRPNYFDPRRPPSASKALVTGVGQASRDLTLDMIAVPAWDDATAEYGPAEFGHGLTAEEARAGWISLFDGQSTFGWTGAAMDAQGIHGGTTSTDFGPGMLRVEMAQPGTLTIGDMANSLAAGRHALLSSRPGPIKLDASIRVKSLHFRPTGLEPIFNGTDMSGWQRIDRATIPDSARPAWSVAEGNLVARGGPGAMEYGGRQFGDFILQLDVNTQLRHANGGVFVRSIPGDFMNGYEVQLYHRAMNGDPARPARYSTGALDDRQLARRLVSRDGEPATMTIVARGPHLATWVNGVQLTDWTDTRAAHENPRQGLRTAAGTIQLQAHDPGTAVSFSNIRVAELPSSE
jgi:enamine deaminase RidA (YjgF/YER057c/UK114 family)